MEGLSPYAIEQLGMASTEPMLFRPRPVDFGSAIEYMRTTGIHKRKFDLNDPSNDANKFCQNSCTAKDS